MPRRARPQAAPLRELRVLACELSTRLAEHAAPAIALRDWDDLLAVAAPLDILRWRVESPPDALHVLDGEACAGDGHEGIQAIFTERNRPDGTMAVVVFDVLQLHGEGIMHQP